MRYIADFVGFMFIWILGVLAVDALAPGYPTWWLMLCGYVVGGLGSWVGRLIQKGIFNTVSRETR